MDEYNQTLVENLHPPQWQNPEPARRYNLVVIGGGTAGLVTAGGAALLGGKVALIEKHLLGGDCTNVGCVPSKALIRASRAAAAVRNAHHYGTYVPDGTHVDFGKVMERLRRVRAEISHDDSVKRFQEMGVDVFLGAAHFTSPETVEVGGKTLRFQKAVIATGGRAGKLPIEGLEESGYLTNETVFSLTERPNRLAVIGGGFIGCELAQAFHRLGSEVILLQRGARILKREDADAAEIIQQVFRREGIQLLLNANTTRVERRDGEKVLYYEIEGQEKMVVVDEILVAVGRKPNIEGLNLESVGVETNKKGIVIDDYLRTTNPFIYAVGDVAMKWKFTHAADAAARIVIQNALFSVAKVGRKKLSSLVVPWCTYTTPEVAHVGMYEEEAREQGIGVETYRIPLEDVDRAVVDEETEGFAKIHLKKGSDKILGATIVSPHAGEIINTITLAMTNGLGLGAIADTIFPYPTQAEVIRKAADTYNLERLTGSLKGITSKWLAWQR
jgi:pyruvate/2-oxoglutarate dehydrogenase complex dihydrolipoamide dehydrogenase (E3) component